MSEAVTAATPSSSRLEHALAAFLRQELSAPVITMTGFLDIIIEDARRFELSQALSDLDRMRIASAELGALVNRVIDAPETIRNEGEDFEAFQSRLRHDLRTPLNAIKGYGEILIEDLQNGAHPHLLQDLKKICAAADDLLAGIETMVDLHGGDLQASRAQPIDVITDLLRVVVPIGTAADAPAARSSHILVVDDIAANRDLLARRLVREGHRVVIAEDGASALESLENDDFDLILLDLMMPGMNGFEVLCRLKSDQRTRHIPVIMISALDEIDSAVRCIEAGAEDYVSKPFNPILLRARIGACLEKKWLRDREQAHFEELSAEKHRSESLLLNILPQSIVTRMRRGEAVIADRYPQATILFSDLVGFTALSSNLAPDEVLEILSVVFSRFDRAVADRGLEKIKTIGDGYMVAGGLPEPLPDHARRVASLGLEMQEIVEDIRGPLGFDLKARIGIHTGPVIAGVIGSHKFVYDVWGDTVNTASRMESSGVAGRVHVSTETRLALGATFSFEPRGPLDIKGKGVMDTYLLLEELRSR